MPMSAATSSILPPLSTSWRSLTRTTRRPSVSITCLSSTSRASQMSSGFAGKGETSSRGTRRATSRAAKVRTSDQGTTRAWRLDVTMPVTRG